MLDALERKDWERFGQSYKHYFDSVSETDPSEVTAAEMDTYASLLYKVGRTAEAIKREEKTAMRAENRNQVITDHLEKMKAGKPTWAEP